MKGLIYKDLLIIKKHSGIFIALSLFYIIMGIMNESVSTFAGFVSIICATFPITTLSYDEKAYWDRYALTMPISRKNLVLSKYILGISLSFAAFALNVIFQLILGTQTIQETLLTSGLFFAIGLIILDINLVIIFKYGVEKGRILMLGVLLAPTAIVMFVSKLNKVTPQNLEQIFKLLPFIVPVGLILLTIASIAASIHVYNNKQIS